MKINTYLIQLAVMIIVIFGGIFTIRFFRTGELLIEQIIGASVGIVLLIASLVWRQKNN